MEQEKVLRKSMIKRRARGFLSFLLSLIMAIEVIGPVQVFAANITPTESGQTGTLNPGDTTFVLKNRTEMQNRTAVREVTRKYFMKSEDIQFSRWEKNDLLLAKRLWQNRDVFRYLADDVTNDEVLSRLNTEIYNEGKYHVSCWPIFSNKNEFLGSCGLLPVKGNRKKYGLAVYILPEYWNRGFGTEACRRVLEHAFDYVGATEIVKILEKLGFQIVDDEYNERTGLFHPNYRLTK